jgi:hypothetical protein
VSIAAFTFRNPTAVSSREEVAGVKSCWRAGEPRPHLGEERALMSVAGVSEALRFHGTSQRHCFGEMQIKTRLTKRILAHAPATMMCRDVGQRSHDRDARAAEVVTVLLRDPIRRRLKRDEKERETPALSAPSFFLSAPSNVDPPDFAQEAPNRKRNETRARGTNTANATKRN